MVVVSGREEVVVGWKWKCVKVDWSVIAPTLKRVSGDG